MVADNDKCNSIQNCGQGGSANRIFIVVVIALATLLLLQTSFLVHIWASGSLQYPPINNEKNQKQVCSIIYPIFQLTCV